MIKGSALDSYGMLERVKSRPRPFSTVLVVRFRYHIITILKEQESPLLAEECLLLGFRGTPDKAQWLKENETENLLMIKSDANITPDLATNAITKINEGFDSLTKTIEEVCL